jgi:hypothetical protein
LISNKPPGVSRWLVRFSGKACNNRTTSAGTRFA